MQCGAEIAWENRSCPNQCGNILIPHGLSVQIPLQQRFIAYRQAFFKRLPHGVSVEINAALPQLLFQFGEQSRPLRTSEVHLVDKNHYRDLMPRKQSPKRMGMRLYAVRTADHQNRIVQDLKRALHLRREIHMSRRIQQGDRGSRQIKNRLLGKNRDTALPFQRGRIEKSIPVVHSAKPAQHTRPVQHRFGQRGFTGIHMCQNSDDNSFHNFLICCNSLYYKIIIAKTRCSDKPNPLAKRATRSSVKNTNKCLHISNLYAIL